MKKRSMIALLLTAFLLAGMMFGCADGPADAGSQMCIRDRANHSSVLSLCEGLSDFVPGGGALWPGCEVRLIEGGRRFGAVYAAHVGIFQIDEEQPVF